MPEPAGQESPGDLDTKPFPPLAHSASTCSAACRAAAAASSACFGAPENDLRICSACTRESVKGSRRCGKDAGSMHAFVTVLQVHEVLLTSTHP